MSIGFSSVGEFAVGELDSSNTLDIPVLAPTTITLSALAPIVQVGATIDVPAASVHLAANPPTFQLGVTLDMPVGVISFTGQVPQILFSANILVDAPPHITLLALSSVDINGGAFVDNPSRQDSFISVGGGVAEFSVGEFGVGEGAGEVSLSAKRAARLRFTADAPLIQTGKIIDPPVATLALLARIPEIDSRSRKLRAYAILS